MLVSVAICTWNRAKLLDQTLAGMRNLRIPSGVDWELLLINNNCTDDTDAVIARHTDALPLRRLFEPKQGLSNARNCAIEHAQGTLLIWTDDDVLVDQNWLAEHVGAFRRWPTASYFGGSIAPWYECSPPAWVTDNLQQLQGLLVIRDLGKVERPFQLKEEPFGANMSFRTEVLRQHPFNPRLGRCGDLGILCEETELVKRISQLGHQGIWVPSALVQHFVTAHRMSSNYLWNYYYGVGRTHVRMKGPPALGRMLFGSPRWMYRACFTKRACATLNRLFGSKKWFGYYTQAAYLRGMIHECRSHMKQSTLIQKDNVLRNS
jgi:glycosyltransferase involved in cell wall biosynthesis